MTRSQVRAACRRMRDHVEEIEEEAGELNLVPYMDIVTNIIIFLLASMINQVSLANINVSVPSISGRRRLRRGQPATGEAAAQPHGLRGRERLHGRGLGRRAPHRAEAAERPVRLQVAHDQAQGDQVVA